MRSPSGARFPPRASALLVAGLVGFGGCTTENPTPAAPSDLDETGSKRSTASRLATSTDDSRRGARARVARVRDADARRTVRGTAPPYVEIESASVEGGADALRFRVTLAGTVPDRMPDDRSILRVTFIATTATGRRYAFEAQCIRPGWGTFASGGPEDAPIPELSVAGPRVELTVDPAYMGGLQPFEWLTNVAWTSGEANYAFDAAPTEGFARFP